MKTRILLIFIALLSIQFSYGQDDKHLELGGALRFNYRYKDWDKSIKDVGGDAVLDVFLLKAKAKYNNLFLDCEYRFYPSGFGGGMLHHGFVGYKFNEKMQLQLGVNQVPFGLLPYASHSWFFNLPYYVGLEDDYDTGIKWVYNTSKWYIGAAIYKNAEGARKTIDFSNGTRGAGVDLARYSYDLARDMEETGQANLRLARRFGNQEVGVSAQYGRYRNHVLKNNNTHEAYSFHYNGQFLKDERLDLKFEVSYYNYHNTKSNTVTLGAYNFTYDIASEATIFTGGIAYTIPVKSKLIKSVQFYEDYNYMHKGNSGFNATQMNVVGCMIAVNPVYIYIDYASGKNQEWLGPWGAFGDSGSEFGLAKGASNPEWHSWFNINVGYYF